MDPPDHSDGSIVETVLLKIPSAEILLLLNHPVDDRSEDQFHGKAHFSAIHHDARWAGHERVVNHAQQIAEIDSPLFSCSLAEVNDHKAFIR